MPHTLTTCTFCGAGCGLYLETERDQVVGVYPSMSHPTNSGRICVRGWHVHEVAGSADRLRTPLLRRKGRLEPAGWDEALGFIAERLDELRQRHGPEAIAFLASPRSSNEEAYLLQKLARAIIGTNHVDHGAGVYAHNSIDLLLDMLGVPATTNPVADLSQSQVILVDGVDLARQLPTLGGIVLRARLAGARLIVVDTRRHRLAESADLFLPARPGTEALLYGAMAKVILDRGLANLPFIQARCDGYAAFAAEIARYDLLTAADLCGVPAATLEQAAVAYAQAPNAALLYSTADEARPPESLAALLNLALLTGQVGRPGAGIYALAEHNNLQGVCDVGLLPDRLPGYRQVSDAAAREALGRAWGTTVPSAPGRTAREILQESDHGVRAVWLGRYDPIGTAFSGGAEEALRGMELVVVQHLFLTGTAKHAHVVLPTTAFGEETVTFTSTDRRIQLVRQALPRPPGLMPAWEQIVALARTLGASWPYATVGEVMDEIGAVVAEYGAATHENLGRDYGRHWPCTPEHPLGTPTLLADPAAARPLRFRVIPRPPPPGPADPEHPLTLLFGDSLYYWHQNILIRHSETLHREYRILLLDYPHGFVEIHTEDARRLGIRDGDRIRLCTARGCAQTTARVTAEVREGTVHVPYFLREVEAQLFAGSTAAGRLVPVSITREAA